MTIVKFLEVLLITFYTSDYHALWFYYFQQKHLTIYAFSFGIVILCSRLKT